MSGFGARFGGFHVRSSNNFEVEGIVNYGLDTTNWTHRQQRPSPDRSWTASLRVRLRLSDRRRFLEGFYECFSRVSLQDVRHHVRRLAQRRCLNVGVIGAHCRAVVADEFLDNSGADTRIFHKACGGVTQCMEGDF